MPETALHPGPSWRELCEDPRYAFLRDVPFKVETNRWGQIIISPTYQRHGYFQFEVARLLREVLPHGVALVECAIRTTDGVKEADAAWYTAERWEQVKDTFDTPIAPEICVEVRSAGNPEAEMTAKRALYLEAGAEEVWVCDLEGRVRFFDRAGEQPRSTRAPGFPTRIPV